MRSIAVLFALAASALAFSITEPTNSTGWTTSGPNQVSWEKVSTDNNNFTIVLSNQASYPPTSQVLAALVDASLGKITVNPPSGGWKTGSGFQVNLVQDENHLSSILAQSEQFTISSSTSSTFSTVTSGSASGTASSGTGTLTVPAASGTGTRGTTGSSATDSSGALNPTSSDTSTTPNNNGAASMGVQAGLFAGLAFLGAYLA
ncbi:hypothetical protein BD413DRAFT_547731 [Trametes elegans]|nr:hypothetical protein BD413DRAFT_547731 [Trametes elegans]